MTDRLSGLAIRLLALVASLCAASTNVFAQEGLIVGDPRHRPAKFAIQNTDAYKEEVKAAIETVKTLIGVFEKRNGPQSAEVGVLLLDIGEGTVRRREFGPGSKTDMLRRGVRALEAGDKIVKTLEGQYEAATLDRSRGLYYRGVALKELGDAKGAEAAFNRVASYVGDVFG